MAEFPARSDVSRGQIRAVADTHAVIWYLFDDGRLSPSARAVFKDTFCYGPADLVIEVASPESEVRDRRHKFLEYQAAKIPEYWLLDQPRREALFYVLDAEGRYQLAPVSEDGIYTSTVLPGFRLRVDWLWRSPLPLVAEALADLPF